MKGYRLSAIGYQQWLSGDSRPLERKRRTGC
jgi:hypothetical protein